MPPEIIEGISYSKEVDVWSFGCFAYELATGHAPFHDIHNQTDQQYHVCYERHPPIPARWSNEFGEFIDKCLEKSPRDRLTIEQLLYEHPFLQNFNVD